jgi:predicted ribosomally synthesized peptide with nif11-like leader
MSIPSVQDFISKVAQRQVWQQELAIVMGKEATPTAIAEWASTKGYDFTPEELAQEIEQRQADFKRRQEAGELSEEELDAVAGGGEVIMLAIGATALIGSGIFASRRR